MKQIKYSICMINLNMENTIIKSVGSIASQLDNRFEIIICDGGSSDKSKEKIEELMEEYKFIKLIELDYSFNRKKGYDRNVSVENAEGDYILLHLDCDDYYPPFIVDWVNCFHLIEDRMGPNIFVSGRHINMTRKEVFWSVGGYQNIEFEDRDLWMRAAEMGILILWDHKDFVIRLPRSLEQKLYKNSIELFYAVQSDLIQGASFNQLLKIYTRNIINANSKIDFVKLIFLISTSFIPRKKSFTKTHNFDPVNFSEYRKMNFKNIMELTDMEKNEIKKLLVNENSFKFLLN